MTSPAAAATSEQDRSVAVATVIARSFSAHELPDGDIADPVSGQAAQRYSQAMLAYSALRISQRTGAADLRSFALRMLDFISRHPENHQAPSVFELAGVAAAYNVLGPEPSEQRGRVRAWLEGASPVFLRSDGRFSGNKYLVEAYAWLEVCRSDVPVAPHICRRAARLIDRGLVATAARHATRGRHGRVTVVLPDPPAYHHLTLGFLARAVSLMPRRAGATRLLVRMARGTASMIGPDGDGAYWGRSQGEGWSLLLGAYGLREAARFTDHAEATTFLAAAGLMVERFAAKHVGGPYGTFLTPSFAVDPMTRPPGIDGYANVATYAGLTALALCWLIDQAPAARPVGPHPRNASAAKVLGGAAGDFAVVRRGDVWLAVLGRSAKPCDLRYGFGVAVAKLRQHGRWQELAFKRPMTIGLPDSTGPSLAVGGHLAFPFGERIRVTDDTITITGGWRTAEGVLVRRAVFRFRVVSRGVTLTVPVRAGDDLEYSVFTLAPTFLEGGLVDGPRQTLASLPFSSRVETGYASSDYRELSRVRLSFHAGSTCDLRISHRWLPQLP